MRIDSRFLRWGVFLVCLGGVPLAVQQGWIPADAIGGAWRFWPLILIGIGVGLVLRRTSGHFLGGLIVAATIGLMLGSLLATGVSSGLGLGCVDGGPGTPFPAASGTFAGDGTVAIELSCGKLTVSPAPGRAWTVSGGSSDGRAPVAESQADRLAVRSPQRSWFDSFGQRNGERWSVGLPTDPGLTLGMTINAGTAGVDLAGTHLHGLSMTTNAGKATVDLSQATVEGLSTTVNAGSARIALPSTSMRGSATVNAGSLGLCVPAGVGLRIESSSTLASNNFAARGLIQSGSTWSTPGYDSATARIDLSLTANAGTIELDPAGGCH